MLLISPFPGRFAVMLAHHGWWNSAKAATVHHCLDEA
jgi:hypothetical protein